MTLLRKALTVSFIMPLAVSAQATMRMERRQISKLDLSLEIPQTLTPMPDKIAKIEYPSESRPQVIYGDECGKASLGITAGRSVLPTAQLDMTKNATLKTPTSPNPQAKSITADGHKAWLITFRSQAPDAGIPNILLITSQNEKAVQVSFDMAKDLVAQYQEAAKASLLSLKFEQKNAR